MTLAPMPSPVLPPQPPGGLGAAAALALAVHTALVAALTIGVDWQTRAPEPVAAELWAAVPELAAPPVVAPPAPPAPAPPAPAAAPTPPPAVTAPSPDIALGRERERRRAEAERQTQREAEAQRRGAEARAQAEAKAAEERLARQREENLRRMLGQANATPGVGSAAQAGAPSAAYQGRVKAAILPNIVYTGSAPARAVAEVEVTLAPGGTVISRRLVKRSGHPDWDEAVLRAVDRTPRLPADSDGRVPPMLLISFRPDD